MASKKAWSIRMAERRGVLWDMDGVLVDTGEFHYQSWMEILKNYQIPFDREKFKTTFGMNNYGVLTVLLGRQPSESEHQEIGDRKELAFRALIHGQARLLPGVQNWLDHFKQISVQMAVASSAPMKNVDVLVDELHIRDYFQAIVSASGQPSKPDPYVFLTAAHAIGVLPSDCVVVEDAVAGVEAARRGGMRCLAVTNTNPTEKLQAADLVVDSLSQLTTGDWEMLFTQPTRSG
jgi:beta-phosphoglucomutase family hydrolase